MTTAEQTRGAAPQTQGQQGEDQALAYLGKQGLTLLQRNYRCKMGEIDLIMLDGTNIVFVEVKLRKTDRFGTAVEMVTRVKQKKLLNAARHFLMHYPQSSSYAMRFDVVGITLSNQTHPINWIKNAFTGNTFTGSAF